MAAPLQTVAPLIRVFRRGDDDQSLVKSMLDRTTRLSRRVAAFAWRGYKDVNHPRLTGRDPMMSGGSGPWRRLGWRLGRSCWFEQGSYEEKHGRA